MTIEYKDSKRITIISRTERQAGSGLTFSDDFSSDKGWETSNSTYMDYDSGNSRLKTYWKGAGAGNNYTVVYDLGEGMVSETKWILRMKINFGSTDGADNEGFIGLSDKDETAGRETAQDFAGVCFLAGYSTTAWNGFYECEADGVILPPTAGNNAAYNFSDSTDYWLEIKRTSATGLTYTVYSDAYSTSLATQSVTIASTVSGLRYIKFANYPTASTNCTGAYADDIQFYNDVTSTSTTPVAEVPASGDIKPTNVQDNSLLVEKDTARRYWLNSATLDEKYSSGWTQVGTQITVSSNQVNFSSALCGTDRRVYKPLGFTLDDKFTVEWEFSLTDSGSSQAQPFALTAGTAQLDNSTTNQDSIYFKSSSAGYQLACKDGTTNTQSSANSYTNGTTLYARLVRDGTSGTLSIYSDSARTTLVNSATHTIPATVTGLNTLQHGVDAVQSGTRTISGTISNVRIWNGITTGSTWIWDKLKYKTNFTSDSGWTMTNKLSVTNGNMYANGVNATEQYYAYYDLGVLSDTKWFVEVDFKYTNSGGGEAMIVGLSSGTPLIWQNGGADAVAINCSHIGSIGGRVRYNTTDNHFTSGGTIPTDGTWKYLVLERYDVNTIKTHIYSTAEDRRNKTNGTTYTGTITGSNITNLRYLQVGGWYVGHTSSRVIYGYWDDIKVYDGVNWE